MSKEEILTECGIMQLGKEHEGVLKAMDNYLIQELKNLLKSCQQIHSDYIIDKIKQEIDFLENGF